MTATVHSVIPKEIAEKLKRDAITDNRTVSNLIKKIIIQHYEDQNISSKKRELT